MDIAELKKRARAARSFEFMSGGFTFRCVVPGDLEIRAVVAESKSHERASQAITRSAIVGWDGVRVEHLVPDASSDVAKDGVEYDSALAEEFFASRGKLLYALSAEIFNRIAERMAQIEAAEKNSAGTSS